MGASGNTPVGEVDYVLHFDADALPSVDALWSVTMYDGDGFPAFNDPDRYALGDRDPLVNHADGSLDLYLQHNDPGQQRHANWLPAPAGAARCDHEAVRPTSRGPRRHLDATAADSGLNPVGQVVVCQASRTLTLAPMRRTAPR
jgi:hypothetical protein